MVNEIIVAFLGPLPLPRHPESRPVTPFGVPCTDCIAGVRQHNLVAGRPLPGSAAAAVTGRRNRRSAAAVAAPGVAPLPHRDGRDEARRPGRGSPSRGWRSGTARRAGPPRGSCTAASARSRPRRRSSAAPERSDAAPGTGPGQYSSRTRPPVPPIPGGTPPKAQACGGSNGACQVLRTTPRGDRQPQALPAVSGGYRVEQDSAAGVMR